MLFSIGSVTLAYMRKLTQTRFRSDSGGRDNCLATAIACILDLNSAEDALQVQDFYTQDDNDPTWELVLDHWLKERGWEIAVVAGHLLNGGPYLVTGTTHRDESLHVCIYEDGELIWDPHPDNKGLVEEIQYEYLFKSGQNDKLDV